LVKIDNQVGYNRELKNAASADEYYSEEDNEEVDTTKNEGFTRIKKITNSIMIYITDCLKMLYDESVT